MKCGSFTPGNTFGPSNNNINSNGEKSEGSQSTKNTIMPFIQMGTCLAASLQSGLQLSVENWYLCLLHNRFLPVRLFNTGAKES